MNKTREMPGAAVVCIGGAGQHIVSIKRPDRTEPDRQCCHRNIQQLDAFCRVPKRDNGKRV